MVEHNSGTIRAVAWAEIFPWLGIVRVFRLAIAVRALFFGAVAIVLTVSGWGQIGYIFGTDTPATEWLKPYVKHSWMPLTAAVPDLPMVGDVGDLPEGHRPPALRWQEYEPINPWTLLTRPALEGLMRNKPEDFSFSTVACLGLCGLWGVAVWALFGAAICRTAAVRFAADEQIGWGSAMRYAWRKWPSYFAAPLLPMCGVLLATIPVLVLGWIMRANFGLLLGGLVWPLVLVAGFLMAILLLGVLFGWPLMWAAISAEGTDSFDALSRSYAYTFQRPLHYLFYAVVAAAIGWLGWLLVQDFAAGVIWLGYWAAGWGCGDEQIRSILGTSTGQRLEGIGSAGATLIIFWTSCVKLLAVGYLFSYFWTASTAIYFLLRRDVDHTEMDEVFLDADQSELSPESPAAVQDQPATPMTKEEVGGTATGDMPNG